MSSATELRTPFGQKDGRTVEPAEVESGLACGCYCPGCGAVLVAKKGSKVAWHFAHFNSIVTQSCIESAIHAAAKQVLLEENWLQVPRKVVSATATTKYGALREKSIILTAERPIRFDCSREEVWEHSVNVRPDIVGYRGEKRFLIEMYFTHRVDQVKREKLAKMGLPSLEVDLSNLDISSGFQAVRQRVLHDVENKEWLFYPGERDAKASLIKELAAEIEKLNQEYDARVADEKNKAEERRRAAEQGPPEVAEANEKYRLLPDSEKERLLRQSLSITGPWPYFLERPSAACSAIASPPRLWQAALFSRFVYRNAKPGSKLYLATLVKWVIGRFGLVENRRSEATAAVRMYLGYLKGCGFLVQSPFSLNESRFYSVVHGELNPPAKSPPASATITPTQDVKTNSDSHQSTGRPWVWRASWPSSVEREARAESTLRGSPYAATLISALKELSPSRRPGQPELWAQMLEENGVPSQVALAFLYKLELVL